MIAIRNAASEPTVLVRSCEICGSSSNHLLGTFAHWPLVQCHQCSFVYLQQVPTYEALASDYPWEVTFAAEKLRREKSRLGWLDAATRWRTYPGHVLDRYRRRNAIGLCGNVLDVGCGGTCRVPEGPKPFGIEISAGLAAQARSAFAARGGRVVHASAVEGMDSFEDHFFSAILMRSYLEHEAQPRVVLQKAFHKLAAGGKIYIRVPNYGSINRRICGQRWCGFRFPDHVNYFTQSSLRRLAENTGFTYKRINWLSPFDDNIIAVLSRPDTPRAPHLSQDLNANADRASPPC